MASAAAGGSNADAQGSAAPSAGGSGPPPPEGPATGTEAATGQATSVSASTLSDWPALGHIQASEFDVEIPVRNLSAGLGMRVVAGHIAAGQVHKGAAEAGSGHIPAVIFVSFLSKGQGAGAVEAAATLRQHDVLVGLQGKDVRGAAFPAVGRALASIVKAAKAGSSSAAALRMRFWRAWEGAWSWEGVGRPSTTLLHATRARGIVPYPNSVSARLPLGGEAYQEVGLWPLQRAAEAALLFDHHLLARGGWKASPRTNFYRALRSPPPSLMQQGIVGHAGMPVTPQSTPCSAPGVLKVQVQGPGRPSAFPALTAQAAWAQVQQRLGIAPVAGGAGEEAGGAPTPGTAGVGEGGGATPSAPTTHVRMRAVLGSGRPILPQLRAQILVLKMLLAGSGSSVSQEQLALALTGQLPETKPRAPRHHRRRAAAGVGRDEGWGKGRRAALPTRARATKGGAKRGRGKGKARAVGDDSSEEEFVEGGEGPVGDGGFVRRSTRRRSSKQRYTAQDDAELGIAPSSGEDSAASGSEGGSDPSAQFKVERVLGVRYSELTWEEVQAAKRAVEAGDVDEETTHGQVQWELLTPEQGGGGGLAVPEEERAVRARDRALLQATMALFPDAADRRAFPRLEYLVKWKGAAYAHVEWVAPSFLTQLNSWAVRRAKEFLATPTATSQLEEEESRVLALRDLPALDAFVPAEYMEAERVLTCMHAEGGGEDGTDLWYLVKWCGLPYTECTWETESDVGSAQVLQRFKLMNMPPSDAAIRAMPSLKQDYRPSPDVWRRHDSSPAFKGGLKLREYQLEGLNWLTWNWYNFRNCILADEMGLGKTIQAVSFLNHLVTREQVHGPFMILAPLSTLGHWEREINTWTSMQAVVYHDPAGGAAGRKLIREHLWHFSKTDKQGVPVGSGAESRWSKMGLFKFNVLLTSYQTLHKDWEYLSPLSWRAVVVDEAHALKNTHSQLSASLRGLDIKSLLLLTGTPLQNDMSELWSLLNMVDPHGFASLEEFNEQFGDLKQSEQVEALQAKLRPLMLRRVKTDVEKSLPPKEETIVSVELTALQRKYYKAVFERNSTFLSKGASGISAANLTNIEMELRKCCNHPYLLRGVEERETARLMHESNAAGDSTGAAFQAARLQRIVEASGKMLVLDKLLHWLQAGGHRVLLFSQFAVQLDIVQDYCVGRGFGMERIDGSVTGSARQAAIDRFNDPSSSSFIFLLSTRAGGVGINLTSADTVIIFDSDWNPQNDLQAQARAHRIGQKAELVRVFRLVTSRTYEGEMFRRASRKLGLHQAVFESGGMGDGVGEGEGAELTSLLRMDKDKVEALLRFGAYAIMEEGEADAAKGALPDDDIDAILAKSATIRVSSDGEVTSVGAGGAGVSAPGGSAAGGGDALLHFKKATFAGAAGAGGPDVADPGFWKRVLGPRPVEVLQRALEDGGVQGVGGGTRAADGPGAGDTLTPAQFVADVRHVLVTVQGAVEAGGDAATVAADLQGVTRLLKELTVVGAGVAVPVVGGLPPPTFPVTPGAALPSLPLPPGQQHTLASIAQAWLSRATGVAKALQGGARGSRGRTRRGDRRTDPGETAPSSPPKAKRPRGPTDSDVGQT